MLDAIIVGSGPAGLCAAIYAKRANLSVLVIEKEYEGTGQIAYTEQVDNYPGLDGISGYEKAPNDNEFETAMVELEGLRKGLEASINGQ